MPDPSYPAARQVAATVQAHFAKHLAAARAQGRIDLGVEPDAAFIEAIIDAAFWASLRREEGVTPTALLPPGHAGQALTFAEWLPLYPAALVASQDGRFTIFQWSPCDNVIHARRVEALLL